ncbi:MAG TPA: sugar ABC transporter ATP-binding protein [Candidatus Dormibacteraeota bacterium]|nr:sugar ABC transporter ATP-binding protein [Candidatus Dormibacteraeota bacterium]
MHSKRALIAARGIHKHYGGITALADVSLEVLQGEIHALVGENGAGKSTLVKIMTGAQKPDAGDVLVLGSVVAPLTPEKARELGIGAVYQEPSLVPALTVLENVFLGWEQRRWVGSLDQRKMRQQAEAALNKIGARVRLDTEVAALSVADRQLVEIARALVLRASVLIFDEPSAVLSGRELDRIFDVIKELRLAGLGILYISHRLAEIFDLADRATVLKDGQVVSTKRVSELSMAELIRSMVGRDIRQRPTRTAKPAEDIALEVRGLELGVDREPLSLTLHSREVLGIAGLVGSGRSRLANALGGIRPAKAGTILRNGEPVQVKSPRAAVRAGIVVIPEDRKREGLILEHSIRENVALASLKELSAIGFVKSADEKRLSREAVHSFGIRPPEIERSAWTLSGGNQQKVVLSKWLVRTPTAEVVILDEPTRGVDVGAKYEIYQLIDELVERGSAVLLISSELPEVIAMSDRVLVMSAGQIVGELKAGEFSEERILHLAVLGRQGDADPDAQQ